MRPLDAIVTSRQIPTIPSDQTGTGVFNPPGLAGAVELVEFETPVLLVIFASRMGTLNCAAIMTRKGVGDSMANYRSSCLESVNQDRIDLKE